MENVAASPRPASRCCATHYWQIGYVTSHRLFAVDTVALQLRSRHGTSRPGLLQDSLAVMHLYLASRLISASPRPASHAARYSRSPKFLRGLALHSPPATCGCRPNRCRVVVIPAAATTFDAVCSGLALAPGWLALWQAPEIAQFIHSTQIHGQRDLPHTFGSVLQFSESCSSLSTMTRLIWSREVLPSSGSFCENTSMPRKHRSGSRSGAY